MKKEGYLDALEAACIIARFFDKQNNFNKNHTSYGLKHQIERFAELISNTILSEKKNKRWYCSNDTLIEAMELCGFKKQNESELGNSSNFYFNISEKSLKRMEEFSNSLKCCQNFVESDFSNFPKKEELEIIGYVYDKPIGRINYN